jgi:hypothetical protein
MAKQIDQGLNTDDTVIGRAMDDETAVPGAFSMPATRTGQEETKPGVPYENLLAYHRGRLHDPVALQRIEASLNSSQQLRAHLESVQYLDLERAAAIQDAIDLGQFDASRAEPLCVEVAFGQGAIFAAPNPTPQTKQQWGRHTRTCVFCRRMRRQVLARAEARRAGLAEGEVLLLNWLLDHHYAHLLDSVARAIREQKPLSSLPSHLREVIEKRTKGASIEQIAAEQKLPDKVVQERLDEAEKRIAQATAARR